MILIPLLFAVFDGGFKIADLNDGLSIGEFDDDGFTNDFEFQGYISPSSNQQINLYARHRMITERGGGKEVIATAISLNGNRRKSCGCLQLEHAKRLSGNKFKKGMASNSRLEDPKMSSFHYLYNEYKFNSKRRDKTFSLSINDFIDLVVKNCYYCGANPKKFNYFYKLYKKYKKQ